MNQPITGKLRGSSSFEPPAHAPNAAMLIDFDNVTMGIRSDLQNQLKRLLASDIFKGKVSVQRAYADWRRYPQYIVPLSEASIDLIFAPAFGSNKKNATDIRLAIDATELVFTRPEIGTFILLSGDSDFSSLVLKLKEYGKYVIGVGIRESSSDLLIQNCDEYFSYSELTGFAKEGSVEHPRHDPWELVVEAVTQMRQDHDVMRSDRLKQVMQEIDPNFNEKDAGFSRFSKFVSEASQRGLLRVTKMENGQFEVDLGNNANVPPAVESALAAEGPEAREAADRSRRSRGRDRERDRAGRAAGPKGTTLAQAFEALRQTLLDLGAIGEESTDAEQVRERMVQKFGDDDPIVGGPRFQRLLRQAHDANLIELVKTGEDAYLLRLTPGAPAPPEEPEASAPRREGARGQERQLPEGEARSRRGGRGRGERGGRGRGRRGGESDRPHAPPDEPAGRVEPGGAPPGPTAPSAPVSGGPPRRNVRFRTGSRRPGPPPGAPTEDAGARIEPPAPMPPPLPPPPGDQTARSLRGRAGSSSFKPAPPTHEAAAKSSAAQSDDGRRPGQETVDEQRQDPAPKPEPRVARSAPQTPTGGPGEPKSLFKRLSGALQKALGTPEKEVDE